MGPQVTSTAVFRTPTRPRSTCPCQVTGSATSELARRSPDGMQFYSANPGIVKNTGMNSDAGGLMRLTAPLFRPFSTTPDEGVQTALPLATASPAQQPSGGFFTESQPATPSRPARDTALARTVYDRTASLVGVQVLQADQREQLSSADAAASAMRPHESRGRCSVPGSLEGVALAQQPEDEGTYPPKGSRSRSEAWQPPHSRVNTATRAGPDTSAIVG